LKSWKEFLRFGLVGVIGFAVDASTLAMMLMADAGVLRGRAVSYVAAASCTWALNRRWTFHDRSSRRARQWAQFLAVNSLGGAVNYVIYTLLVFHLDGSSMIRPIIAVAVGSICGLAINFLLSKHMIFQKAAVLLAHSSHSPGSSRWRSRSAGS
jgi:putative flippase GtrA